MYKYAGTGPRAVAGDASPSGAPLGPVARGKIPTGIYGLNRLLDGGINAGTISCVIGSSGAGKTMLATQFLKKGLEDGHEAIYITLDEPPEQIIAAALDMGWEELQQYLDEERLVFVDASGKQFSEFITNDLRDFVSSWKGRSARIVVDPLTPVMWSSKERYEQRDMISFLFRETKKIGTVIATLEEHGLGGDLSTPETVIPMYLSDAVIHLRYFLQQHEAQRMMKTIKCRRSGHSHRFHPYYIFKGVGVLVRDFVERKGMASAERRMTQLPEATRNRVRKIMRQVSLHDLQGLELSEVLGILLDEYAPEETKPPTV